MKTDDIRQSFLDFFAKQGHRVVTSDSLVPENDPTLLFTGAGMNQFKEYFLGLKKDTKRAASSQKCLRTGDLDNVGRTAYHHSFFEMLGNFSFGDYFKAEAIQWAWQYLTGELKIPADKLRISVHHTDDEAFKIWRDKIKIREDWIYKMGDESNFWPANAPQDGPNGPCGPCSEIYFDMGIENARPGEDTEHIESKRFAEIWNLVFTQFDRQDVGKLVPLANKNIDTGMGLERLACVLQGKKNNYEIDIFQPILQAIENRLNVKRSEQNKGSLYAIADHARAVVFSMADGVIPSNEGRGYVIRKLIRRALWHAHQLAGKDGLTDPFLYQIVPSVADVMQKAYPELRQASKSIEGALKGEEERFLDTLETGLRILEERLKKLEQSKQKAIPGEIVFELYDTYGFPEELTRAIAEKRGMQTDQKAFERLMEGQRQRAKQASQIADSIFVSTDLEKQLRALKPTVFLGYKHVEGDGKVVFTQIQDGKGVIALNQTPFYAESGGQVGDHGSLAGKGFRARVVDTRKSDQIFVHYVEVEEGKAAVGDTLKASVDTSRRDRIMRNHTATHLLHAALREILGEQVRQLGSLVAPERLRFDFSYPKALTPEQLKQIEDKVNSEILKNTAVSHDEKAIEEARTEGAVAFFGEKYGDRVRVITVPGFSKEFCGGTHCYATGQIGAFLIVAESSVASGTRRIEALTGEGVLDYLREIRAQMMRVANELKTTPAQLEERIQKLKSTIKNLEKNKGQSVGAVDAKQILQEAKAAGGLRFAAFHQKALPMPEMLGLSDSLRSLSQDTVYLLGTESEDKINFLLGMSKNLAQKEQLDLRELMKELSPLLGASGGGRRDLIQGGGKNENQLQQNWPQIISRATTYLEKK